MSPRRAPAELARIRQHELGAGRDIEPVDCSTSLPHQVFEKWSRVVE